MGLFDAWLSPEARQKEAERQRQLQEQGITSASDLKVQREITLKETLLSSPASIARFWHDEEMTPEDQEAYTLEYKAAMARPMVVKDVYPGMPGYNENKRLQAAIAEHDKIRAFLEAQRY